jgi:glycerol uptake facilitator protein
LFFVAVGTGAATVLALGPLRATGAIADLTQNFQGDPVAAQLYGAAGVFRNTFADVFGVAFAFATALAALIYAFGGVSGAHFNPAVTFALAVSRRFRWREVPLYWVVQCLGGIAGAFVVAGIYGQDGAAFGGTDILFGATTLQVDWAQALLAEALISFILVTAIMAVAVDPRAPKGWSGLIIGLALAGGILVTSAATGGSANFARSLGPFVASLRYDTGGIPWNDLWVYLGGPLVGAAAAALVYEGVTGLETASPAPQPGAATGAGTELDVTLDGSGNQDGVDEETESSYPTDVIKHGPPPGGLPSHEQWRANPEGGKTPPDPPT